jgi:protein-tyrosine phosphatase
MIRGASLILTASREHRAVVVELVPNAQRRTFTLPQAARLAAWLADGGTRRPAGSVGERVVWLAGELDGARGDAERPPSPSDDDLPDPHVGLADTHEDVLQRITENVAALAHWLAPADDEAEHEMTTG